MIGEELNTKTVFSGQVLIPLARVITLLFMVALTCFDSISKLLKKSGVCYSDSCSKVDASAYSYLLGLPLSFYALLASVTLLLGCLLPDRSLSIKVKTALQALGFACVVISILLQLSNFFALKVVCSFCIVLAGSFVLQYLLQTVTALLDYSSRPVGHTVFAALATVTVLASGAFAFVSKPHDVSKLVAKLPVNQLIMENDLRFYDPKRPLLVLFQDFECHGCSELWRSVRGFAKDHSEVQIFIRHAALPNHKQALQLSALFEVAAAHQQGFEFADKVHLQEFADIASAREWLSQKMSFTEDELQNAKNLVYLDNQVVRKMRIDSVPIFVFETAKGERTVGASSRDFERLLNTLDAMQ